MRALFVMLAIGCASTPPLRPIGLEHCSSCSWAHIVRLTENAIDTYDRGDFDAATERFIDANARGLSARGFFNICLSRYRADERAPDPAKLDLACRACVEAYTFEAAEVAKLRPHLQRLLAMIDATAKRRSVALTCDRSKAR